MSLRVILAALALANVTAMAGAALAESSAIRMTTPYSFFEIVEESAPSAPLAGEAEYRAFAESIGDRARMTYGSFAPEAGGAVARDVVLTFGENADAGLKIRELRLHSGVAPAAGDIAAERLDARGVASFGLAKLVERSAAAIEDALEDGAEEATEGEEVEAAPTTYDAYDVTFERLMLDGLILHAPDPKVARQTDDPADMLRFYAALGRAYSARTLIARGMSAEMATRAGESVSRMTIAAPLYGARGVARGDVDHTIMQDLTFSLEAESAGKDGAPAIPVSMKGGFGLSSISELKLAKLLEFWSRGEMPSPKELDIVSLGVWETENERYAFGDAPFYSVEHNRADLSKFQWFLPTSISWSVKNLSYDFSALMKIAESAAPAEEGATEMRQTLSLLDKHGLSKFSLSGDFLYEWSPETGAAKIVSKNDVKTLGRIDIETGAVFPTFKEFAGLHPKKGKPFDPTKLNALFAEASLRNAKITAADKGALSRGFALAADMQALKAGGAAGSIKGPEMRAAAAFGMRSLGTAPSPLAPVYAALADFVAEGGVLSLAASPDRPIPFSGILVPGGDGDDPLTRLNLSAKRTPE